MSPINKVGVLAFASAVLAVPHSNQHRHLHNRHAPPAYGGEDTSSADPVATTPPSGYGSSAGWSSSSSADPASSAPPYPIPGSSSGYSFGTGISSYSHANPTAYSSSSESECDVPSTTLIWKSSSLVVPVYGGSSGFAPTSSAAAGATTPATGGTAPTGGAVPTGGAAPAGGYDPSCPADVTVTTKVYTTITVTASAGSSAAPASSAAPESYNSPAAPASSADPVESDIPSYDGPAAKYGKPGNWGWNEDTTTAAPPPATTDPVATSPASGDYSSAGSSSTSASSKGPAPTYSGGGGFRGKRGLAYNDASLTAPFLDSPSVGWAYNWEPNSKGYSGAVPFIPELHTTHDSVFTDNWSQYAQQAIDNGAEWLFSLNEPDMPNQANLSPQDAATAWMQYMEPFAKQAKLVAPSVTNAPSGSGMGQDWLKEFIAACTGCTISAVNQHWYNAPGNDVDMFKQQVGAASSIGGGLPVFVGEFGGIGSDSDISEFLKAVMSWMDGEESIVGYAYFQVAEGLLNSGSGLSGYGETYCNGS